mgnify:FL=1
MIAIKLKEYLALHPDEGVELLTEYGYYTLTSKDIRARLRRGGEVRSVTGRPIAFAALLEQEVIDQQPGDPPLLRTGRVRRKEEPC